jgi:hypothetical protein
MAGEPLPLILTDASLKLSTDGTEANLVELACVASHIELMPDTTVTTVDTMCGSVDYAGVTKWHLTATLVQSFDPQATEETLSAIIDFGGPVAFEVVGYKSQPVSATNPAWTGLVDPRPYAPISGDAGAVSEVAIEWGVIGTPIKNITPLPLAASSSRVAEPANA